MPYIYILMNGVPCELSHTVSRFGGTREQRRVRASLLSSVPRAPCASFSRKNKKKVRQLENVPRRVYTPTFAPSLPKNTVTYHQVHYFEKGAGEQSSAARTKTKIATVGKSMPSLSQSLGPRCRSQCQRGVIKFIITKHCRQKNAKHRAEEVVMKRLHN